MVRETMLNSIISAGQVLAQRLKEFDLTEGVVLAVPNGGIILGNVIASELNLPLDISLIKEIGHQLNQDFPIGHIGLRGRDIRWASNTPFEYIESETQKIQLRLLEKHKEYTGRKEPISLYNKTVIITNDSIKHCDNFIHNISIVKKNNPKKIIAVTEILDELCLLNLNHEVDHLVYLESQSASCMNKYPRYDYSQFNDQDIIRFIKQQPAKEE